MSEEKSAYTPIPSVQRLPVYLHFLKDLRRGGQRSISCTQIAKQFNQLSVQVRKDLAITGISGRPRVGYKVDELIDAIESFLGWDKETTAFLVGAGSLGSAILGYHGFNEHGLRILMAFDSDPKKIGTTVHGYPVFSPETMGIQAQRYRVDIGILTVPADQAQESANRLVEIGVRGIWNYTPRRLVLPENIVCVDVKLSASFAVLSKRLADSRGLNVAGEKPRDKSPGKSY
ncbi:MAG: redox-sensing transcriptional repressor Rex [Thermoguttaceae bacterium]|nr:redox-sensing transcriptional repressor Rex [Thermoguttaceae bacterium]